MERTASLYGLVTLLFNGFPIPQTESGARESIRYMGELVEEGWSILIFPEGERTVTGEIGRFLPGVGMIASRLAVFRLCRFALRGLHRVLPPNAKWPHPGRSRSQNSARRFITRANSIAALARRVEEAVRAL